MTQSSDGATARQTLDVVKDLAAQSVRAPAINPREHYLRATGPIQHKELEEGLFAIRNVGWTLGNDCPYRCKHCYSMSARDKGMNFRTDIVDRIVGQLRENDVSTVNLGGNEPLFTNGRNPKDTLLPYIIDAITDAGMLVGLTTSGITAIHLERDHKKQWRKLNDLDISFDSPFEAEHNDNRGAKIYPLAIRALELAQQYDIDHSIIMCAMKWNFDARHVDGLLTLANRYDAMVRINAIRPVEATHMDMFPTPQQYYNGFSQLLNACDPIDLGEPTLAAVSHYDAGQGCPCGRTSLRIHSITPDGKVPVSPCVYMHDYKVGDLLTDELANLVRSPQFSTFRRRNANPAIIPGCAGCVLLSQCRGGCASRSYLSHAHTTGQRSLFVPDPYCPKNVNADAFPQHPSLPADKQLVHIDYLCTWIGQPRAR